MSSINLGNQKITFDFKQPAKAEEFNTLLRDIIEPGVYKHPSVTIQNTPSSKLIIAPFTIAVQVDSVVSSPFNKLIRIESLAQTTIEPPILILNPNTTWYLYCVFSWVNANEVYLDFGVRPTSPNTPIQNEVVFGTVSINNLGQIASFTSVGRTRGMDKDYVGHIETIVANTDASIAAIINEIIQGNIAGTKSGWNSIYSGADVNFPYLPTTKVYSKGVYRLRLTFTYGTNLTDGSEGNVTAIDYEWSTDSGTTYAPIYSEALVYQDNTDLTKYGQLLQGTNSMNLTELAHRGWNKIGHLPALSTVAKNNLVAATNELYSLLVLKADLNGSVNQNFAVKNLKYKVYDNGDSAAINWSNGGMQKVLHDAGDLAKAFTFTNFEAGGIYTIILDNQFVSSNITWPIGIKWHFDSLYIVNNPNYAVGKYIITFTVEALTPDVIYGSIYGIFQ